jgi:hypothetical protein
MLRILSLKLAPQQDYCHWFTPGKLVTEASTVYIHHLNKHMSILNLGIQ